MSTTLRRLMSLPLAQADHRKIRSPDRGRARVEHMGINHRRAYVVVTKEFLNCTDVVALLE